MLKLIADNTVVDIKRIQYSDGAVGFDLGDLTINTKSLTVSVDPTFKVNSILDELTQLMLTLGEVKSLFYKLVSVSLFIPYLPYARNDRKFSFCGNFGLDIFIRSISDLGFTELITIDPHNPAIVNKLCEVYGMKSTHVTQLEAFHEVVKREHLKPEQEWDLIVAQAMGLFAMSSTLTYYPYTNPVQ